MRKLVLILIALSSVLGTYGQTLPSTTPAAQWGCPSSPSRAAFDTTCFLRTNEIRLGQGKFDHFTSSDVVYAVIPYNRPSYAISIAIAWDYYRNVLGHDKMSINQWFATSVVENGFVTYNNGEMLNPTQPFNVPDVESGTTSIPCLYSRGCNSNSCGGAGYCWHVSQNVNDGPFHNTLAGYQTIAPYVPGRYPAPATTYLPKFNGTFPSAAMSKTFYDLSIYRRAQYANGVDLATIESAANDPYGVEAAQAYAYNIGPNGANAISNALGSGYSLPAGIATNTNWAVTYYSGGVSCYAERVASITAVLDNNEAYAVSHYPGGACGGNANNWDFFDFYDAQIKWDSVALTIDQLLITMYPEFNAAGRTTFKNNVKAVFDRIDADHNGAISFRYEMGPVIDEIIINLPKDDPAMNAMYALYNSGCNLGCMAPYTEIKPDGPTALCPNQDVLLVANVDSPSPTLTLQWFKNGVAVPAGSGGTNDSLIVNYANAGTYTLVVCWQTVRTKTPYTAVTCCAQPECSVTITQATGCSSCTMNFNPVITANACTGMYNGSVAVTVSNSPGGNLIYSWTGTSSGSATTSATNYTITGLRDGRYTITVQSQTTPTCRMVKTITIVPTTVIRESLTATANNTACPVQLQATLVVQRPSSCNLQVSYGAMGSNWDPSYSQELRVNGLTYLTMNKGYSALSLPDNSNTRWDWWPWSWPSVGTGNAPNVVTVAVNDGDTISVFGNNIVPLGTPVQPYVDGAVHVQGTGITFTQVGTSTTSTGVYFRYQGYPTVSIPPTNGTRQMQNSWVVSCPVVSPPAYTYS